LKINVLKGNQWNELTHFLWQVYEVVVKSYLNNNKKSVCIETGYSARDEK